MTTKTLARKTENKGNSGGPRSEIFELLTLIENFGNLLVKETDALMRADFKMVDLLQPDKKMFAKDYHILVTNLAARKDEMATLELSIRERLIRARTNFTIILNDNLRALEASKASTRRLVDRILDTARKTVTDDAQTSYSAKGHVQSYKTSSLSLSADLKL